MSGKSASVDHIAMQNYPANFTNMIFEKGYSQNQVSNVDERIILEVFAIKNLN